jgi:hypothetical protein
MKRWSLAIPVLIVVFSIGSALLPKRASAQTQKPTADQVFKNIQVLKGIPVDDFMGTMGIMSDALGFDCSDCHAQAGTSNVNWAADNGRKIMARRMVTMMAAINKEHFQGRQLVTCYSCHRGRDRPLTTPTLETVYGTAPEDMDDVLSQAEGQPAATVIIDKYLAALGGAEKLAAVKSYAATGHGAGFGGFGGNSSVQVFAKFPDERAMFISYPDAKDRDDTIRTFNGHEGWLKTPLTVLGEYELTGGELDGAKFDAELAFPAQLTKVLTKLKVSLPATIKDLPGPSSQTSHDAGASAAQEHLVNVVQGTGPRGLLVTMYFDQQTSLLLRVVRFAGSPIGRIPTQVDYSDYRDVDGIKMPFRIMFAWLDGRDAIQLSEVKLNVPIDEARFGRQPVKK